MGKYLFVVPPFYGHINPTLGIGAELLHRGHEVLWMGIKKIDNRFIPENGKFIVPQELEEHRAEIERIDRIQQEGTKIRGIEILRFTMTETYIPFCNFMVKGLLRMIDDFHPDIIIHDENMFAGAIAATIKDVRYVTSIAVPPGTFQPQGLFETFEKWQTHQIVGLQQKFGISGNNKIIYSKLLNLVYTSREFVGNGDSFPDHYQFVGPIVKGRKSVGEFDFGVLKEITQPIIYVSLGTVLDDIRKDFFEKIVVAFADQPFTFVVATNPNIFESWPKNFIVQSFVPQSELLLHVDAIIYHGGFNTVNEALTHGIPMVIIPIAYDQFHIASLVVNCGSGISLKYKRMTTDLLKNSLREVLENPSYKQAALKIGETLKTAGGTDKATDLLENLLIKETKI